jgi:hypothetical protein
MGIAAMSIIDTGSWPWMMSGMMTKSNPPAVKAKERNARTDFLPLTTNNNPTNSTASRKNMAFVDIPIQCVDYTEIFFIKII